ncbi:hypothetical protein QYE76_049601 [Lolium multiflorum]|uniref:Uncharacterized protein n=1 Tax=Lolium multiflorum TaxID=4521 RepID=A0AAD8SPY9_LOLMU|nr:hypothetical protein QYE76_049601 [Lolium multiflorum]
MKKVRKLVDEAIFKQVNKLGKSLEEREEEIKRNNDLGEIAWARNKVIASSHETNKTQTRTELIEQAEKEKEKEKNDLVEENGYNVKGPDLDMEDQTKGRVGLSRDDGDRNGESHSSLSMKTNNQQRSRWEVT